MSFNFSLNPFHATQIKNKESSGIKCVNDYVSDYKSKNFGAFFLMQVLHTLTKNLQSPGIISFGVPGNKSAKIFPQVNYIYDY